MQEACSQYCIIPCTEDIVRILAPFCCLWAYSLIFSCIALTWGSLLKNMTCRLSAYATLKSQPSSWHENLWYPYSVSILASLHTCFQPSSCTVGAHTSAGCIETDALYVVYVCMYVCMYSWYPCTTDLKSHYMHYYLSCFSLCSNKTILPPQLQVLHQTMSRYIA